MTAELTAEEIVTKLLSSHEILKPNIKNINISSPHDLGEYLNNLPEEEIIETNKVSSPTFSVGKETNQYTFIKEGGWNC